MTSRIRSARVFALHAVFVLGIGCTPVFGQQPDRAHQVGAKVKCMCGGCGDSAGKCYHVGGAFSGPCDTAKAELKEIDRRIALGESDDLILQSFVQQYGPAALIEPPNHGIGRLAWWTPFLALFAGLCLVVFVLSRWKGRPASPVTASGPRLSHDALEQARQRAARETED